MRPYVLIFALMGSIWLPWSARAQTSAEVRPGSGSYFGVRLTDLDADRAKELKLPEVRGVEVAAVVPGSPADTAGIRQGDVLISYNGETILGGQQFVRLVQETPQGRKIKIQLWREAQTMTVTVTIAARQNSFEAPGWFTFTSNDVRAFPIVPAPMLLWSIPLFGIECEPIESQLAQFFGVKRGVLIRSVESGSAAERASLRAGDVVTAIGDRAVADPHDVISYLREHRAGNSVSVSFVRERRRQTAMIVVPENQ
jgi:serine protease Do